MAKYAKYEETNIKHSLCVSIKPFDILIVDDDEITAEAFGEILKNRGHVVTTTNKGMSCVGKCQTYHYDIIFMDFHLDDMNGVDITDLIKNVCDNRSMIFAFTGDDSQESISKYKNIGMTGAIIKPLDMSLINKLMNSLESKKMIQFKNIKKDRQLLMFCV